jgi:hypothetical protein
MRAPKLPNFFVVGTGKAGTTSLFHYLAQHPQVYMSPIKEPCYFASEIRVEHFAPEFYRHSKRMSKETPWIVSEWEDYVRLFENVRDELAIGEASAAYLWSETAAERIAERIPAAKIVVMLRDPAERAFSQYLHQLTMGFTRSTFREHMEQCLREPLGKLSIYRPHLDVGLYSGQVQRYFDRFPRDHVRIYWYEEAWRETPAFFADLFTFLGVDPGFSPDTTRKSLQRQAPRFPALNALVKRFNVRGPSWMRGLFFREGAALKLDPEDRRFLIEYYRDDIGKLSAMLDRDLSAWLR